MCMFAYVLLSKVSKVDKKKLIRNNKKNTYNDSLYIRSFFILFFNILQKKEKVMKERLAE